jgi:PhoPQ-activated pathogenicity-related protein
VKTPRPRLLACCLLLVALLLSAAPSRARAAGEDRTPLDDYVAKPDPAYRYELVSKIPGNGLTTYVIDMTSQRWLSTEEVDRPEWKHWVVICVPDEVKHSTGLLYISGGANGGDPPSKPETMMAEIAKASKGVVTELKMVPNQALVFNGEQQGRKEDSLIAYTWDKFLRTGDVKWPARLPMTKAAVRAMDTTTSFCASEAAGMVNVERFMVCGGSKRGWTTWTTAAVDKRVVAIVPFVIDMLNVRPSFIHHWEAYGFWAPAVGDYVDMKIMDWNDAPEYQALLKIEEPFEYRSRLTMPKFIVNATGDQFFLPDSSQFYFDELPGVKYLRYVPNAEHSLKDTDAPFSLLAYYSAIVNNVPLPEFSWTVGDDESITVKVKDAPKSVKLWHATNEKARDFRVDTIGKTWKSEALADKGEGTYLAKLEKPTQGWTAFMVELTYPNPVGPPFKFTTQVKVTPDVLPYKYEPRQPPK